MLDDTADMARRSYNIQLTTYNAPALATSQANKCTSSHVVDEKRVIDGVLRSVGLTIEISQKV